MFLGDSRPVMDPSPTQRINSEPKLRAANDFEVNNVAEVIDISR